MSTAGRRTTKNSKGTPRFPYMGSDHKKVDRPVPSLQINAVPFQVCMSGSYG